MSTNKIQLPEVKRGSTFRCNFQFKEADVAQDFNVSELTCRFEHVTSGKMGIGTFTKPSDGLFTLSVSTEGWPLGVVEFDVKRVKTLGGTEYTPTMTFTVVEAVTP